jgi:hypothetical protein
MTFVFHATQEAPTESTRRMEYVASCASSQRAACWLEGGTMFIIRMYVTMFP